jgi:hypothetical protein
VGEPDRLFGYPVVINNSMASTVATTNKTVLFELHWNQEISMYLIQE